MYGHNGQFGPILCYLQVNKIVFNFKRIIYVPLSSDMSLLSYAKYLSIFNRLRDKRNWIAEYSRIKASFSHKLLLMLK
jgi:hypothetical protein